MAPTIKTETLDQQLTRQRDDRDEFTRKRAGLEAKQKGVARDIEAASKGDDTAALARLDEEESRLAAECLALDKQLVRKEQAIAETARLIAQRDRAAAIREIDAHAKSAADVAPEIAEATETLADALQRFAGQCAGVYRVGAAVDHENERGLRELTSKERMWRDVEYHLRAALGLSTGPFIHGTALDQANELTTYAATIR